MGLGAELRVTVLVVLLGAGASISCGGASDYVWVQDVPQMPVKPDGTYVVRQGDVLQVRVFNDDTLTTRVRVRQDGRITMPLLGEVQARGKSPHALGKEIATLLERFVKAPIVTVAVEETRAPSVTLVGELKAPGVYSISEEWNVLDAIAAAGGLTEFADEDEVFVLRKSPALRIRFRYRDLIDNRPEAVGFKLVDGDVVSVE